MDTHQIECKTCHRTLSTYGLIGDTITCDSCGDTNSIAKNESKDDLKPMKPLDPYDMWHKGRFMP